MTFNPSLDYIVAVDQFTAGILNRTKEETIFPGGKGINVSMVLANLGVKSEALGFVAGFTGKEIEESLHEKGIMTNFVHIQQGDSRINVKIRSDLEEGQEETEINGMGPQILKEEKQQLLSKLEKLETGDTLVLAGSIPNTLSDHMYYDIMKQLADKQVRIVVDATKNLLMKVLELHPFLIKPNHHELGELFDVQIKDKETASFYGKKLQELGAKNVLISMAEQGAVFVSENDQVFWVDAPKGQVVNSVGAGDSMVAGFLAGYDDSQDVAEALLMGICAGSASAFSKELASREQVEKLKAQVCVQCIEEFCG